MKSTDWYIRQKTINMNKIASLIKPLMPILSATYGIALIYVTALPVAGDNPTVVGEMLTWLITLAGIAMTLYLVQYVEPKMPWSTVLCLSGRGTFGLV